jgi:hypothetical protein
VIDIIREHNMLNGYRFALVEYGALVVGLSALVAYYFAAARWLDAAVWLGIVANSLTIAVSAAAAIRSGAVDHGTLPMRRRAFRDAVARHHPGVGRRTSLLIVIQCIPFLLAASVTAERLAIVAATTAELPPQSR